MLRNPKLPISKKQVGKSFYYKESNQSVKLMIKNFKEKLPKLQIIFNIKIRTLGENKNSNELNMIREKRMLRRFPDMPILQPTKTKVELT
jgi:hypothetical protein